MISHQCTRELSSPRHFVGGSLLFSFDDFALDCEWRLLAIPQILPDCKAKKQERDRSDQIFFETVVEVAVGNYDLRQGTIHVRPTVSRTRRRPMTRLRIDVPDLRTCLRPGGHFLVERNDPGDDHRADDKYVGSSSDLSNHCRAPVFFVRIVHWARPAWPSLIFG